MESRAATFRAKAERENHIYRGEVEAARSQFKIFHSQAAETTIANQRLLRSFESRAVDSQRVLESTARERNYAESTLRRIKETAAGYRDGEEILFRL